ncbi:MAG: hypothetical protein E6J82_12635 [Deltaproteobacteria bacterium]|nr:MAG: hypothetical protein E6J82_12635 [Deltaproteobacteria bacterium]
MKRIVLVAAVVAACGGSSNIAANRNRAGSGSSTLLVTATATVTASDTSPSTNYLVTVKNGQNAGVTGATVSFGAVSLTDAGGGNYTGSSTSYPSGDLSLSVVTGTDQVQGVVLGYPGAHAINAPTVNSTVSAGQPLHVSWTTPSVAQSVTITTRDFNAADVSDTGSYDIAGTDNPARTNQRVIIVRSNQLDLAGALSGSLAKVTVTRRVDPFIVN